MNIDRKTAFPSALRTNLERAYHPHKALGQLFEDVQIQNILSDNKQIVDGVPSNAPFIIAEIYRCCKNNPGFNIKRFTQAYIQAPTGSADSERGAIEGGNKDGLIAHLHQHWHKLLRKASDTKSPWTSLVGLPHPYIVPGGRFREMFYWDSYFTMVGLIASQEVSIALGMLRNFRYLIDSYGFIPNGNRSYFQSRSQPPFYFAMLLLCKPYLAEEEWLSYFSSLEKEYSFWMDQHLQLPRAGYRGSHLVTSLQLPFANRYNGTCSAPRPEAYGKEWRWASNVASEAKPSFYRNLQAVCESGWDFSSRWFSDGKSKQTMDIDKIAPVDLNALLYGVESLLVEMATCLGEFDKAKQYQQRALSRRATLNEHFWDHKKGCYQDIYFDSGLPTGRLTLAMCYPLFTNAATSEYAANIAEWLERKFLKAGGLVTTCQTSSEQWDAPNGWPPLQYVAVVGLRNYGYNKLATVIAKRWNDMVERQYHKDGRLLEKYNVMRPTSPASEGDYPTQDGFGWTNGVTLAFHALLSGD